MTRDDLDLPDLPASGDVTREWADGVITKSSPPSVAGPADTHSHLDSVTSHRIVAPTLPTDVTVSHG